MALSETVTHSVHDLAQGITELLFPFFLTAFGLHVNLGAIVNSPTVGLAIAVFTAAFAPRALGL